jgi:hypothetical protein
MQLVGTTKGAVLALLVMVIMAYTLTLPPADAYLRHAIYQRHGGDIRVFARYQKPEKRTSCRIHDYRGAQVKKYRFYIDGWVDARGCYSAWKHGFGR